LEKYTVSIATLERAATVTPPAPTTSWKLWLYTNYDCNLTCKYCVARSGPNVPRRALAAPLIRQLVDEAAALDFSHLLPDRWRTVPLARHLRNARLQFVAVADYRPHQRHPVATTNSSTSWTPFATSA